MPYLDWSLELGTKCKKKKREQDEKWQHKISNYNRKVNYKCFKTTWSSTCEGRKVSISTELFLPRCGRNLGDVRSHRWQLRYTRGEVSGGAQFLCGCGRGAGRLLSLLYVQLLDDLLNLQGLVWGV